MPITKSERGLSRRAPYATQACDVCRRRKVKCDEVRPICGPCSAQNRQGECKWTGEIVKVPRTEAHFETLQKRVKILESHIRTLQEALEKCKSDHGGIYPNNLEIPTIGSDDGLTSPIHEEHDDDDAASDIGRELSVATQNLTLEDGNLMSYGNVAPFRFQEISTSAVSRFPGIVEDPSAHYVLYLTDSDGSHIDFNLDWSRYLPKTIQLDRREHDTLLDLCFKFFTSWCLRVVPPLFLRDMYRVLRVPPDQAPPKTPHYSPMLHNAIVALAAAFSDNPNLRDIRTRRQFAKAAKAYTEEECEKPTICVVQALSLLGSFHSSNGDQNLGYLYFGMSTRMALTLGLSVDCSKMVEAGLITYDDMLDRNWAHWTGFSLDVCWSLYVGRDCTVAIPLDTKSIPVPFVDSEFDRIPFHHPPSNVAPQPSYLSKTFAATCNLCVIIRRVMEVVNGLDNPHKHTVSDEIISKLDLELHTWKANLPPELDITQSQSSKNTATPHRMMMHLLYWLTFILLHRPFFIQKARLIYSADKEIDHVKLCKRSAENITELLASWQRLYGLRFVPVTLFQAVFSAGTVYLLLAVQAASGTRLAKTSLMSSLARVDLCIKYLHEVGETWQSATNIAEILRKLSQEQIKRMNLITNLPEQVNSATTVHEHDLSPTATVSNSGEFAQYSSHSRSSTSPPLSSSTSSDSNASYNSAHSYRSGTSTADPQYSGVRSEQPSPPVTATWPSPTLLNSGGLSGVNMSNVNTDNIQWMADGASGYGQLTTDIPYIPTFNSFELDNSYFQQQLQSFGPTAMPMQIDMSSDDLAYLQEFIQYGQQQPAFGNA